MKADVKGVMEQIKDDVIKLGKMLDVEIKKQEDKTNDINTKERNCFDVNLNPRKNKIFPMNLIIYGAPGTGKTYSTPEYAVAIIENKTLEEVRNIYTDRKSLIEKYNAEMKNGKIVFTTFHQNYEYEDFIQGLRPNTLTDNLCFDLKDGIFKRIADKALFDEENNYIIIIDEINRANISKVFGELITLIEEDKRWGELNQISATLPSGDIFAIPNNLYIVGTMNSADKSISLIDSALRRRFSFIEQQPDFKLIIDPTLSKFMITINEILISEMDSTDLLIGHSYFINKTEKDLCNILNVNVIPLLYEYFYDNRKKVANILNDAISKANLNICLIDNPFGRISTCEKDQKNDTE